MKDGLSQVDLVAQLAGTAPDGMGFPSTSGLAAARVLGAPSAVAGFPLVDGAALDPEEEQTPGGLPNLSALIGGQSEMEKQQTELMKLLELIAALMLQLQKQTENGDKTGAAETQSQVNALQDTLAGLTAVPSTPIYPLPGGGMPSSGGGAALASGEGDSTAPQSSGGDGSALDPSTTIPSNTTANPKTVERQGKVIGANLAPFFDKMVGAAKKDGIDLRISSGFRTRSEQERLWEQYGRNPARVAPPGTSNHEKGNAIDFANTPGAYDWLKKRAPEFGFKNYPAEAWHYSTNGR